MLFNGTQNQKKKRAAITPAGTLINAVLILVLIGGSAFIQNKYLINPEKIQRVKPFKVGHLPSPQYFKVATFGYDTFFAHYFWLRSIQSFGGLFRTPGQDYTPILSLFDTITELEPRFYDAYEFGAMVIGEEVGDHEKALELLEKGMFKNPRRYYKLAYNALFQCAWNADDYNRAKLYAVLALKCIDCPDWVAGVSGWLDGERGHARLAFENWFRMFIRHVDMGDTNIEYIRLQRAQIQLQDWALGVVNDALVKFEEDQGRKANNLQELVDNRYFEGLEIYSWSKLLRATDFYRQQGGDIFPHFQSILNEGLIKGNFIPENPKHEKGFMIYKRDGKAYGYERILEVTKRALEGLREKFDEFVELNGYYPEKLEDIPGTVDDLGNFVFTEPLYGEWDYDRQNGTIKSPTLPDL